MHSPIGSQEGCAPNSALEITNRAAMVKRQRTPSSPRIASASGSIHTSSGVLSRQRSSKVLQKYASTRKFGRRHELQREGEHIRNTSIVVYSKRNPDEEDTVMAAQWRIVEALAQEQSIFRRLAQCISRTLGTATCQDPTVIMNHVLLGSRENAEDSRLLNMLGITHIYWKQLRRRVHLPQAEPTRCPGRRIDPHFQTVAKFIKRVERLRGRVLIHCISGECWILCLYIIGSGNLPAIQCTGVSRSPALLIAYLMIDKKIPLLEAYNMVKRKRHIVQPNQAFRLQLAKYELMLFGASSVATTPDKDWNFYAWNEVKNQRKQ
ncbi:Protein-tyrosine phosphatase-like [Phytophthora cactorum]|nr:Protein-tyrosine phosphatase-like [Phytophthora cactorum]